MNLREMREEVKRIVQDLGIADSVYDAQINRAYTFSCEVVPLPNLKRLGVVTLSPVQDFVSLWGLSGTDSTFNGNVRIAYLTSSDDPLEQYPTMEALYTDFVNGDQGEVEAYCVEGQNLWYALRPEEETLLNLIFYQTPQALNDPADIPEEIPDSLHYDLLVRGACMFMYETIEDGTEQQKINTLYNHTLAFDVMNPNSGINRLSSWVSRSRQHKRINPWVV